MSGAWPDEFGNYIANRLRPRERTKGQRHTVVPRYKLASEFQRFCFRTSFDVRGPVREIRITKIVVYVMVILGSSIPPYQSALARGPEYADNPSHGRGVAV